MNFRLSALADQDLVAILSYVAADHQPTARDVLNRIYGRISQLSRFPELGRARSDIADGVRGLLISPYVALTGSILPKLSCCAFSTPAAIFAEQNCNDLPQRTFARRFASHAGPCL